jgi:hypothetical protein
MRPLVAALLVTTPACAFYADETTQLSDPDPVVAPLACPDASPGRVTVCGQLLDVVDDGVLDDRRGVTCDRSDLTGACAFSIRLHDALAFAADPAAAHALEPARLSVDGHGRFVAHDLPRPAHSFVAIVTDDAPGADDLHRVAVRVVSIRSGATVDVDAYVVHRGTDLAWSEAAGLEGPTFVDRGAVLLTYVDDVTPIAGVGVTSGDAVRSDAYYFADTDPTTRLYLDVNAITTGPDGAALVVDSPLAGHSGTGAEPAGCTWDHRLAVAIPGTLLVQRIPTFCP